MVRRRKVTIVYITHRLSLFYPLLYHLPISGCRRIVAIVILQAAICVLLVPALLGRILIFFIVVNWRRRSKQCRGTLHPCQTHTKPWSNEVAPQSKALFLIGGRDRSSLQSKANDAIGILLRPRIIVIHKAQVRSEDCCGGLRQIGQIHFSWNRASFSNLVESPVLLLRLLQTGIVRSLSLKTIVRRSILDLRNDSPRRSGALVSGTPRDRAVVHTFVIIVLREVLPFAIQFIACGAPFLVLLTQAIHYNRKCNSRVLEAQIKHLLSVFAVDALYGVFVYHS
mmetsp:Transcript_27874/g.50854  ORF Transcript_27874/g.50854 Transcript_27874/m.50854 type:complete len:282 (-) Transcript_27874:1621-2466(-)